jgi:uncharacterized protein YoxC
MNDFVIDNLKRWRKEMDEYRENMQDIRSDVKVIFLNKKYIIRII